MDELAIELQVGVPTLEDIIKSLKAPIEIQGRV
ncbi:hypothetical protein [Staphylococcus aureus]